VALFHTCSASAQQQKKKDGEHISVGKWSKVVKFCYSLASFEV
jgi:hypothetical protein